MGITEKPNQTFLLDTVKANPSFSPFRDILAKSENKRSVKAKASKKKRGR